MVISRKKQPLLPCTPLRVNQIAMEAVGSYKYLGVWLTSSLDWSEQVASVCKKARQQIGIIYRRFYGHLNSWALRQMYLSYVRPHLEYAVPVWDPHHLGHIEALEKVQRFALKMCTKSWDSSYEDMLTFCNLPTLCQRRRVLKLTFLYQLMRGHFIFPNAPLERRSIPCNLRHVHPSTLLMPSFRTNAHQFSFFPHAISIWNSLPASIHSLDTVSSFKHAISLLKL